MKNRYDLVATRNGVVVKFLCVENSKAHCGRVAEAEEFRGDPGLEYVMVPSGSVTIGKPVTISEDWRKR